MSSKNYLYIDFGNIFTKLTAIDVEKEEILGSAIAFSTHNTNILDGYYDASKKLYDKIGNIEFEEKFACSSIDVGLRMVTIGIISRLSADASKKVALDAGVNVIETFCGKLSGEDIEKINNLNIDMVLLCGGTDGGNKDSVIYNANKLLEINKKVSIIYAGNTDAAYDCRKIFEKDFWDFRITQNVMPVHNTINFEPVIKAIKEAYVERISKLRIYPKLNREISGIIMPTSYAILNATNLLSKGIKGIEGMGALMVVDCGGSAVNVYSAGIESLKQGKRTWECFGLRHNIDILIDGLEDGIIKKELEKYDYSIEQFNRYINIIKNNLSFLPLNKQELVFEEILCMCALQKGISNHVGTGLSKNNEGMQNVKDLSNVKTFIGIGSTIVNCDNIKNIIDDSILNINASNKLVPISPDYYIYNDDIMYALGLLAESQPEIALEMLKKYLHRIK